MKRNRNTRSRMTEADLRAAVEAMPGAWDVRPVMGQNIRLRWLAVRERPEVDETGRPIEPTRQFESWVDAEDLIEALHRRNVALGLEKPRRGREATHA